MNSGILFYKLAGEIIPLRPTAALPAAIVFLFQCNQIFHIDSQNTFFTAFYFRFHSCCFFCSKNVYYIRFNRNNFLC